jgi:hypothetical protein
METPEQILVGVVLILAVWYVLASIYNRRRGYKIFAWLRDGVPVLGDRYQARWLGSAASGARIDLDRAKPPFRRVELIYLLESRELLPLWLFDLLRQKRDQVIFKGTVSHPRPAEIAIVPATGRAAVRVRAAGDESWHFTERDGLLIAGRGPAATEVAANLAPLLQRYGRHVREISWSKNAPQLIAIFNLTHLPESGPASELFQTLQSVTAPLGNRG